MSQTFIVHYYISKEKEDLHIISATTKLKCDAAFLKLIKKLEHYFQTNINTYVEALKEGGVVNPYQIDTSPDICSPHITSVLERALGNPTLPTSYNDIVDIKIDELLREGRSSEEIVDILTSKFLNDHETLRARHEFYETLSSEQYIDKVSFQFRNDETVSLSNEWNVEKTQFGDFIMDTEEGDVEYDKVFFEIVMPNYTDEKNYKWKVKFQGDFISISMDDTEFKEKVLTKKIILGPHFYVYGNISAKRIRENDMAKISEYSLRKVYDFAENIKKLSDKLGITEHKIINEIIKPISIKTKKNNQKNKGSHGASLFPSE